MFSCSERKTVSDIELYGNSFIRVDPFDFKVPYDWEIHDMFDNAFQIQLPPYMKQTQSFPMKDGYSCAIFTYCDTTDAKEYHYGRIGIDYYRHETSDFNKANEYITLSAQESFFAPVIKKALSGGKMSDGYTVPEGELLNGPFYNSHHLQYGINSFYAYDAYYRRKGNTNEGPVSCHIYYLSNKTEATMMTVSYHDKDSLLFKDLFNFVKTFIWVNIHD